MTYPEFLADKAKVARTKPRVKGSVRFAPYFKAQWYDASTLAWRDIAERFPTENKARARFDGKKQWRVMEVTMDGHNVI